MKLWVWGGHGKIISLNEAEKLIWGHISPTHATKPDDGRINWQKIIAINTPSDKHPAFAWCNLHNVNWLLMWYLPAYNELLSINDNIQIINSFLQNIPDAVSLQQKIYWSSTESVADSSRAFAVSFPSGSMYERSKDSLCSVRAISTF